MKITVEEMTKPGWMYLAAAFTTRNPERIPDIDAYRLYLSEHSPIRTRWFWVEMRGIPSFVSTHLVRHKIGAEHYVMSNREDRGGDGEASRKTLINHAMMINAQALINMARKRLCNKAHEETREVMVEIQGALFGIDRDLSLAMVPDCEYRGKCYELKPCGPNKKGE
jgi:hypothetical protein